jgi:biotin carboxyl carrier protein
MPGRVLRVDACVGDEVTVGTVLAVIEAMKMELEITAPHDGRVSELRIAVGDQIDAGKVLAVIEGATE